MKTYRNISTLNQLGLEPGEVGERELTSDEEERLLTRGAVEIVSGEPAEPDDIGESEGE